MLRKSVTTIAVAIAGIAITYTAANAAHIVGNTEPTTVSAEGGEWLYGANAGRAWSSYSHPTRWHAAVLNNHTSSCVAPGEIARITGTQKRFTRDTFNYVFCAEPEKQQ